MSESDSRRPDTGIARVKRDDANQRLQQSMHLSVALACFAPPALADDFLSLSLEQLLEVKVVSASRYEQKSADVAAAPQVISADEIRAAGARNLAEALGLFGGVHTHRDGVYTRLGAHGFLRAGDYNARVLLLVDGRRFNDMVYDGASLGEEGPIDVSLIERLEYIPGPGSSVYGSNALFGVINIITKKPDHMPAAHAGAELSNQHTARYEGGIALKFDNGGAGMLQLSHYQSAGRNRDASELGGAIASGQSAGRDREWSNRLFARYDWGDLSVNAIYVNREINIANGAYFQSPDVAAQPNRDRMASVAATYTKELAQGLKLATHLALSEYIFRASSVSETAVNERTDAAETASARWLDADVKLIAKWRPDSILVAGIETARLPNLDFMVTSPSENRVLVARKSAFTRWGLYAQNDWTVTAPLTLSMGLRLDGQSGLDSVLSPRFGAIFRPGDSTAIKMQHGVAFRNPNAYELYYNVPDIGYRTNPSLREERVTSSEITLEREFGAGMSVRMTGFRNRIDHLIDFLVDPVDGALVFSNVGAAVVRGVQTDLHLMQAGGWRARAGATFQQGTSHEAGSEKPLRNSPRRLGHIALFTPHFGQLAGSLVWQYVGPQQGRDSIVGGYALLNATLVADEFAPGWTATLGVKNLLNRAYLYPLGDEFAQSGERGSPRELWLGARVRF
jgi:iron complex outermembrane receptor protein